jgi:nitrate reductase beta subunit
MEPEAIERMFRLLAIAKYDERYVIPQTHAEAPGGAYEQQGACGISRGAAPATFTRRLL